MEFVYTENVENYHELMNQRLGELRCKHVMKLESEKSKALWNYSLKNKYEKAMWGFGSGVYKNEEVNRIIQIQTIRKMIYKKFRNPFRVVIDDAGIAWIDNLHSCIRDIIVYGNDIKLKDTYFYLIDLNNNTPIVLNYKNSLSKNMDDIMGAISYAEKRNERTNPDIRNVNYTIFEFMEENDISKEAIALDERFYENFKNKED